MCCVLGRVDFADLINHVEGSPSFCCARTLDSLAVQVPGEYLIMKRRAQEEHLKIYDDIAKRQYVYKAHGTLCVPLTGFASNSSSSVYQAGCDWETSGIQKAQSNAVKYRYDNMKFQRERDLQGRRARFSRPRQIS